MIEGRQIAQDRFDLFLLNNANSGCIGEMVLIIFLQLNFRSTGKQREVEGMFKGTIEASIKFYFE